MRPVTPEFFWPTFATVPPDNSARAVDKVPNGVAFLASSGNDADELAAQLVESW